MSESSGPRRTARRGCEPCRVQHLKCDKRLPICSVCLRTGVECTRESDIRFKHLTDGSTAGDRTASNPRQEFEFSRAQTWTPTGGSLRFLDETPDLVDIYNNRIPQAEVALNNSSPGSLHRDLPISTDPSDATLYTPASSHTNLHVDSPYGSADLSASPRDGGEVDENVPSGSHHRITSDGWVYSLARRTGSRGTKRRIPTSDTHERSRRSFGSHSVVNSASPLQPSPFPSTSSNVAANENSPPELDIHHSSPDRPKPAISSQQYLSCPLTDIDEAKLLWHYVENLSRSFDLVDPARHFRIEVPQRAVECPTVLNAILALSARHLSLLGEYDPLLSDQYHQKCLESLIPMLSDPAAISDENVLVSAIILRHLEEIEVPLMPQALEEGSGKSHLLGTHVLVTAHEDAATAGDLRQAAFWVGLRQEIFMALINQHCILPPLEHRNIDRSINPAPDHVWSNRMVVLCADVLRYCFGEHGSSTNTYNHLAQSVDVWYDNKPFSFAPVCYCRADETNVLPQLCFLRDEVSIGWQHYYIAKILLGAHNPKVPRLGLRKAELSQQIDAEIKENVLMLCGICLGNPAVLPNFTYAAMAIIVAGDKFVALREQEALLGILNSCESRHALAVGHVIQDLKNVWKWPDNR